MELSEYDLKEKIAQLENLLLEKHPTMPLLLSKIHDTLKQQPENVILLSEEEIAIIVSGLKEHTNTSFAAIKPKKAPSTTAKLKNLSADDI